MTRHLGRKIDDQRERSILLAYMTCVDKQAPRFIVEDVAAADELIGALHLLLSDVWARQNYGISRIVRSGVFFEFTSRQSPHLRRFVGEWNSNRRHGVVYVDAIHELRQAGQSR